MIFAALFAVILCVNGCTYTYLDKKYIKDPNSAQEIMKVRSYIECASICQRGTKFSMGFCFNPRRMLCVSYPDITGVTDVNESKNNNHCQLYTFAGYKELLLSLPASSFSESTSYSVNWDASKSPFNAESTAWLTSVNNVNQWIQVDFGKPEYVLTIETKGRPNNAQWIKTYKIEHSQNDQTWLTYQNDGVDVVFPGNTDYTTKVSNDIIPPIRARYLRLRPLTWQSHIALKWELYTCL